MSRKKIKTSQFLSVCVLITFLLLCSFNAVYAYFTATSSISGSSQFGTLNVGLSYIRNSTTTALVSSNVSKVTTASFNLQEDVVAISINNNLKRGNTYSIKVGENVVDGLQFTSASGSCDAYIRFKLEAYKVVDDPLNDGKYILDSVDTTNYGQYFELTHGSEVAHERYFSIEIVLVDSEPVDFATTYENYYIRTGSSNNYTYTQNTSSTWDGTKAYYTLTETEVFSEPLDFVSEFRTYYIRSGKDGSYVYKQNTKNTWLQSNYYYIVSELQANVNVVFATGISVKNNLPVQALDSKMAFKITYQAVQKANNAYLTVFSDDTTYIGNRLSWGS